jgi:hypothetical protein
MARTSQTGPEPFGRGAGWPCGAATRVTAASSSGSLRSSSSVKCAMATVVPVAGHNSHGLDGVAAGEILHAAELVIEMDGTGNRQEIKAARFCRRPQREAQTSIATTR